MQELNEDLKIEDWAYRWIIEFNSDVKKQAQEVLFLENENKKCTFKIILNNSKNLNNFKRTYE